MSDINLKQKPLKLGILGAGSFVQRRILPILKDVPSIQVVCLHKQNFADAKQLATQYSIPYAVSDRQELMDHPEVEAVLIATPNHCHEEDAMACARARKPVLCEKPLAPTTQAIIRMQHCFAAQGVSLFVGHSLRFKPAIQKAREFLQEGRLGKLLHFRAFFTLPVPADNWRYKKSFGGGVLQDIGVHLIDLIQFVSGEKISLVHAVANQEYDYLSEKSEETVIAIGRLTGGASFSFECSLNQPLRSGFEVIGERSRLVSAHSLRQTDGSKESLYIQEEDSELYIPLRKNNIYAADLTHFANVLRGKETSLIDAEVGLQNQRIIESAYASIHQKKEVLCIADS